MIAFLITLLQEKHKKKQTPAEATPPHKRRATQAEVVMALRSCSELLLFSFLKGGDPSSFTSHYGHLMIIMATICNNSNNDGNNNNNDLTIPMDL